MKKAITIVCILIMLGNYFSQAQKLQVTGNKTAQQLVNKLLGPGVTASNIQFTGTMVASGFFNSNKSNIGLDSGILLTTGNLNWAPGPNDLSNTTGDNHLSGDPDLTSLAGNQTYDASILEFDFIPQFTDIKFRYVFASEEYNEFVCTDFNDVFAFFLSGPGINGKKNLAQIPGSSSAVSINSVNNGSIVSGYGAYMGAPHCELTNSAYFVDNVGGTSVEYDGFTTALTAQTTVIAGGTYHIRLAIADVSDRVYDSGVFLEAGSFSGTVVPPVASFQASKTILCADDCIEYTDKSTGGATSWKWSFPGAFPDVSTDQNPQTVCYLSPGLYDAKLVVSNGGAKDSLSFTNYINVNPAPPVPTIIQSGTKLYFHKDASYISYQWNIDTVLIPGATDTVLTISHGGNYNVRVLNAYGCSIGVGINVILGLQNHMSDNRVTLSSNPVADKFTVYGSSFTWFKIYDALGRLVQESEIKSARIIGQAGGNPQSEINVATLPTGIYFLQLKEEGGIVVRRFVKK